MNIEIQIPPELFTVFNKIVYFDEPHKYYVDNKELISVTTLIHKYQENFDEEYWSQYKSNQLGLKQYEIIRAWNFINLKGTTKGSIIHDYAENLFLNKIFKYPKELIYKEFGFDPILKEYEITKKHVDNFYHDTFGKLIPIRTELVMHDAETLIGGMLDILFYNVKMKEFQIWDWKTNKEFSFENKKNHLLNDLFVLEDCDLEIYSLQLGIYKYIIEKYIPIKLGKSYLVWFSHNNDNYKIIEAKDRSYFVNKIIENRKFDLVA
jgi:hypothetical protein